MRIVHVESGRHLYGGARQVLYLIDGLRRRGVDNVLICPPGSAIGRAAAGADVVELPMRGDLDVGTVGRLKRAVAALEPDLVHVHSRRGADWFGAIAAAGAPWPAVLTRRVDAPEWPPLARLKYSRYAAVVAISRAIEAELVERVGVPPERVQRIASGVDTERFRPDPLARARLVERLGLSADAVAVGVVAQLIARKGHRTLIEALPGLVRRHPDVIVLFFGRGPLERNLRAEIERRGVAGHVKLAGFRDDLPELLPGLDILVHPAAAEGLGLAVLEALAGGVPVVTTAAGGLADVVEDGVQGVIVPPSDPEALRAALERLIADPAERRRLGEAGRRHAEQHFSAERMAERNLALYRRVLDERRAKPLRASP